MEDTNLEVLKNMPLQVTVTGNEYKINLTTTDDPKLEKDNRGITYLESCEVYLDKELSDSMLIQTLYHELAHIVLENSFFDSLIEEKLGHKIYEIMVDSLGRALQDMTTRNDLNKVIQKIIYDKYTSSK